MRQRSVAMFAALLAVVLAAALGGCTSEGDALGYDPDEVVFISGLNATVEGAIESRVGEAGDQGIVRTTWADGDVVTINFFPNDPVKKTTLTATRWKTEYDAGWNVDKEIVISKVDFYNSVPIEVIADKGKKNGVDVTYEDVLTAIVDVDYDALSKDTGVGRINFMPHNDDPNNFSIAIELVHARSLITATVDGTLPDAANGVKGVQARFHNVATPVAMTSYTEGTTTTWQCFAQSDGLVGFTVNFNDNTSYSVDAPKTDPNDYMEIEQESVPNEGTYHYPFAITLNEGKTDVTFLPDYALPGWENGGNNYVPDALIRIFTEEQLAAIGSTYKGVSYPLDGSYVLMNDITLTKDWVPIGSKDKKGFYGSFNGNGHKIINMTITSGANLGLFYCIGTTDLKPGYVYNLHFDSPKINSTTVNLVAGSVAASLICGIIDLCSVTNADISSSSSGSSCLGGIVGEIDGKGCQIVRSWVVESNLINNHQYATCYVGGIAGSITSYYSTLIAACYTLGVMGYVSSNHTGNSAGGLVGHMGASTIYGCYAKGVNVFGKHSDDYLGALIGLSSIYGEIVRSYATFGSKATPEGLLCGTGFVGKPVDFFSEPSWVGVNGAANSDNTPTDTDAGYTALIYNESAAVNVEVLKAKEDGSLEPKKVKFNYNDVWGNNISATVPPTIQFEKIQNMVDNATNQ